MCMLIGLTVCTDTEAQTDRQCAQTGASELTKLVKEAGLNLSKSVIIHSRLIMDVSEIFYTLCE